MIVEAIEALEAGEARELEFGVSDDDAFAVGLACGGTIRVLIEPVGAVLPEALLADLVAARAARTPVAYSVDLDTGVRSLTREGHADRFRMDRSGFEEGTRRFVTIHNPPLRLVVVGAVHIAQALLPMARIAGYDPVVIDPRETFGSETRFPGETILHDWPDEAVDKAGLDSRTALVLLTHDPKLDDPAISRALRSACFTSVRWAPPGPMPNAWRGFRPRASPKPRSRASTGPSGSISARRGLRKSPSR